MHPFPTIAIQPLVRGNMGTGSGKLGWGDPDPMSGEAPFCSGAVERILHLQIWSPLPLENSIKIDRLI
jgi:hypothetical protein